MVNHGAVVRIRTGHTRMQLVGSWNGCMLPTGVGRLDAPGADGRFGVRLGRPRDAVALRLEALETLLHLLLLLQRLDESALQVVRVLLFERSLPIAGDAVLADDARRIALVQLPERREIGPALTAQERRLGSAVV